MNKAAERNRRHKPLVKHSRNATHRLIKRLDARITTDSIRYDDQQITKTKHEWSTAARADFLSQVQTNK